MQGGINAKCVNSGVNEVKTFVNKKDMARQIEWIQEAKTRSDICIVSLHAHESKYERQFPADFIKDFAKQAVDNGADVVVCHGPHLLRGIEMYEGKPIFYSLGNFIGMNDLVKVLPEGSYERFGIDSTLLPSKVFDLRSEGGTKGFPGVDDFWITVVPVIEYEDGGIKQISLYPVRLKNDKHVAHRGKPYLVEGNEARYIIEHVKSLSEEFGTKVEMRGNVGIVVL